LCPVINHLNWFKDNVFLAASSSQPDEDNNPPTDDDDSYNSGPTAVVDVFEFEGRGRCTSLNLCDEVVDSYPYTDSEVARETGWGQTLHYMSAFIAAWSVFNI
jgi:hypothetical protein